MRSLVKGILCASLAVIALLGALILPAGAGAAEPVAEPIPAAEATPPPAEATPPAEPVAEQATGATPAPETTPPTGPVAEQATGATPAPEATLPAEATPPPAEATPPAEAVTAPASEEAVPAPEATLPSEEATPAPEATLPVEATSPAEPIVEATPPPAAATPPVEPVVEQTKEAASPLEPIKERASEEPAASGTNAEQVSENSASPPPVGTQGATPDDSSGQVTTEVSNTPIYFPTTGPTVVEPEELSVISAANPASIDAPPRLTVAQRVEEFSCEFSRLATSVTDNCVTDSLSVQSQSFIAASTLVELATGTAARGGISANDSNDGSTGGSRSVSPPPGPAPGGAFGGSATSGAGTALSGFFSLASLLQLAAPRAMRLLRLSCRPWLTAFFVLIPERPG